jgi:hypothetical protein
METVVYPDYQNTEPLAVHGITNNCAVVIYSMFVNDDYDDCVRVAWRYGDKVSDLETCVIEYDDDGNQYFKLGGIVLMMADFIRV